MIGKNFLSNVHPMNSSITQQQVIKGTTDQRNPSPYTFFSFTEWKYSLTYSGGENSISKKLHTKPYMMKTSIKNLTFTCTKKHERAGR